MSGKAKMHSSPENVACPRVTYYTARRLSLVALCAAIATITVYACNFYLISTSQDVHNRIHRVPLNAKHILRQCAMLKATPGPATEASFRWARETSDRFEPGTRPTLIKDAHIWTGARNGTETVAGDVLLSGGVIKGIGYIPRRLLEDLTDLVTIDAKGGWVTPGLVDLHSHVGVLSIPATRGTFDVNSAHGPVLPWLRSIDGFNTHDDARELAIAGGVTSAQILPGSGNAIGGQAFMVKFRKTAERSPTSMVIEPPHNLNGSQEDDGPLRWRHMKQACGENLIRYGNRMDAIWAFRSAYNEARKVKQLQDDFCVKAEMGLWDELTDNDFPDNLQWEMLVDVLRGRVKIANHCYEEVDLDDIVRISNEFSFPIASFQHASEAWLVPDVLKRTWGGTPAIAIFASNHRYKRESYRGSPFAARVLADNDIPVVMKSDHPVLNSRYLMYEAQQAHYYGLPPHLALASVTSVPARAAGLNHRIGMLAEGADADVVLWDAHPLHLGATPRQVWIDGIPQLTAPVAIPAKAGRVWQEVPPVPTWDVERKEAVEWEGLPPLAPKKRVSGKVVLRNVQSVWVRTGEEGVRQRWVGRNEDERGTVVFAGGQLFCVGPEGHCFAEADSLDVDGEDVVLDLHGGSVGPGLMTFGSPLGIEEIAGELSTGDGTTYDPYVEDIPSILHDVGGVVRAADALQFGTRNALIAYRAGVTFATSSLLKTTLFGGPTNFVGGLAVTFRTGSKHALEAGAIVKPVTALHITLTRPAPYRPAAPAVSVSTQIAVLRRLLLVGVDEETETGYWFKKAVEGTIPLIIEVGSADIMALLLQLKADIEDQRGGQMRMVFSGATEAHLLASDIAKAKVGVVLTPVRPFPGNWDHRRVVAGPPITNLTAPEILLKAGVTVAVGIQDAWEAANIRWEAGWAALDSHGSIDTRRRYELVTTNLEKLMGIDGWIGDDGELVVYEGGDAFNMSSKVVAVASPRRGVVDTF